MNKCSVCGRTISNQAAHFGLGCLKNMCALIDMDKPKNLKGENILNTRVAQINNKKSLNKNEKTQLTNRYLTLQLLNKVQLNYYDKIRNKVSKDIETIGKSKRQSSDNTISLRQAYEIYKYYIKFKTIINNNEKEFILSEVTQNIVWNAFNFGLSKYYDNKKYMSGINQQLQYIFWKSGVLLLKMNKHKISAKLLNHAIEEKPEDLMITEGYIVEEIKNSKSFKDKINNLIKSTSINNIIANDSVEFIESDLKASFHNMNLSINGSKLNGKWKLHIKLDDIYDFIDLKELHEYFDNELSGFILSTANNAAILSTSCGVLNIYNIIIEFDYEAGDSIEE